MNVRQVFLFAMSLAGLFSARAQHVGIGVDNPTRAKLEVYSGAGDGATGALFGGPNTGISLQHYWPTVGFNQYYGGTGQARYIGAGYAAVQFLDPNFGGLFFDLYTNGAANTLAPTPKRALSLFQSGSVAIGQYYHNSSLSVARINGGEATAYFYGSQHHSAINYGDPQNTYIRAGRDNGTVFINDIPGSKISMSGYVGINTADPVYPIEIRQLNGRALVFVHPVTFNNWHVRADGNNPSLLEFLHNGLIRSEISGTSGEYYYVSDQRLKKDIRPLPSLLDKVMQLQPVSYHLNNQDPAQEKSIGFLAQEVKNLFPGLVHVSHDTTRGYKDIPDLHTMNYAGFGVLAIKALQEQQQLIRGLQETCLKLQAEITGLRLLNKEK